MLGEGSYGNVFRAKHRETGEVRAVKVISKAKIKNKDRFKMEIDILKKLVSCLLRRTILMSSSCLKLSRITNMSTLWWKYARGASSLIVSRKPAASLRNSQLECSNKSSKLYSTATRIKYVIGSIPIILEIWSLRISSLKIKVLTLLWRSSTSGSLRYTTILVSNKCYFRAGHHQDEDYSRHSVLYLAWSHCWQL